MRMLGIAKLMHREERAAHEHTRARLDYSLKWSRFLNRKLAETREELLIAQQQLAFDKLVLESAGL